MDLREPGCRKCQRSSAGDCGDHGPKMVPTTEQFGAGAPERPEPLPDQRLREKYGGLMPAVEPIHVSNVPGISLYHFVCSMDVNHVIYVKAGYSMPPVPVICPWKCGWMNLLGEITARV